MAANNDEAPLPSELLCRFVRGVWWEFGQGLSPDLFEDCLVRAELAWWQVVSSARLCEIPAHAQRAYVLESVRNAVLDLLDSARRSATHEFGPEVLELAEVGSDRRADVEGEAIGRHVARRHLADQVENPQLATGLRQLGLRDQGFLDLAYRDDMQDSMFAAALGCSLDAAKKGRQRALVRLRRLLIPPPPPHHRWRPRPEHLRLDVNLASGW